MKISKVSNTTPERSPSSPPTEISARFVWEALVPRLIGSVKLAIIEALMWVGRPLSAEELTELLGPEDCKLQLARYHAEYLVEVGVLEMLEAEADAGDSEEARFFFPQTVG